MIKLGIILAIYFGGIIQAEAKNPHWEKHYQKIDCDEKGGIIEYRLPNGKRVDCLTEKEAIENDFSKKWAECLGQALYYGYATGKDAVCGLIVSEKSSKEYKILKSLEGKPLVLKRVYEIQE